MWQIVKQGRPTCTYTSLFETVTLKLQYGHCHWIQHCLKSMPEYYILTRIAIETDWYSQRLCLFQLALVRRL